MAKKIKLRKETSEEEVKVDEAKVAEEAARDAAGIQDEFQARGFELVEWVQEKQGIFLGILGAVVAGGLAFGVYTVTARERNLEASVSLAAGLDAFDATVDEDPQPDAKGPTFKTQKERATKARELFAKTAQEHPGTGAATISHLYAAHAAMRLGDFDGALQGYDAFLAGTGSSDPLRFAGLSGAAAALEGKGDRVGTMARLNELLALPSPVGKDAALVELGRIQLATGDAAGARATLERLAKEFPQSALKGRADELLASLGESTAASPATPTPASPPAPTP